MSYNSFTKGSLTSLSSSNWRGSSFGSKAMSKEIIADKSLCDIDYSVTLALSRHMDCDNGWEELASSVGYNTQQVLRLRDVRYKPNGSPTNSLLWELGCEGYRVSDLYEKLKEKRQKREMEILEEYVRKYKQPPLSSSVGGARQDQLKKEVEDEKASPLSSHDINVLLSQVKIPGFGEPGGACSSPSIESASGTESAVNYNYSAGQPQAKVGTKGYKKPYYEKHIPGPDSYPSSSKSGNSFASKHQPIESEDSTPSAAAAEHSGFDNRFPIPGTPPHWCSGAANLQRMLFPSTSQEPSGSAGLNVNCPSLTPSNLDMSSLSLKPSFKYKELCDATDNFSQSNLIGQGAFGKVYRGTLRSLECAIKRLNSSEMERTTDMKQFISELSMLKEFIHENIVVLYGYASDDKELCLVYQHLINGSLEDRLLLKNGTSALKWERRLNILVGACKGLNFLHTFRDKPLIHGDIKSANILLDQNWEAKIADLGQASYATGASKDTKGLTHLSVVQSGTKLFGTKAYHAPEVLNSKQLSIKSDIYAMGVVFLEVCSGLRAYDPNRGKESFLVGKFSDLEEDEWLSFQDQHLKSVTKSSFTAVLTIANNCLQLLKKKRPKTDKLLECIQACYNQFLELFSGKVDPANRDEMQAKHESLLVSLNSSVPGSRIAAEQGEILRQNNSFVNHTSFTQQQVEQPSCRPNMTSLTTQNQDVLSSQDGNVAVVQTSSSGAHPSQLDPQSHSNQLQHQNNSELPKFSSFSSTSSSLEGLYGDSLPIRLQKVYDQIAVKKEQLRQEGVEDPESLSVRLLSQELENIQQQLLAENSQNQTNQLQQPNINPPGLPAEEDYFPKADPKKLLELYAFDQSNFPENSNLEQSEPGPAVLQSDPRKMAYMQQFDESCFSSQPSCKAEENPNQPQITSTVNQTFSQPSSASPCYSQPSTTNNLSHNYYPPYPTAQTFSQNPYIVSTAANGAIFNSGNLVAADQTLNSPSKAFNGGRGDSMSYQNIGTVPEQAVPHMGDNPSHHLTYSHLLDHDSQQINEKVQKKSILDDLMAEIMSEDSLDVDG